VAVVSAVFAGSRFDDRKKTICLPISSEHEVHPYTPEDFTEDDPFVKEIIETEIEL